MYTQSLVAGLTPEQIYRHTPAELLEVIAAYHTRHKHSVIGRVESILRAFAKEQHKIWEGLIDRNTDSAPVISSYKDIVLNMLFGPKSSQESEDDDS